MKSAKIIILLLIGIFLLVFWFYVSKSSEQTTMQKQWETLLESKAEDAEISAIQQLTATVSEHGGYWEVMGITKNNSKVNIIDYKHALDDLQRIEVIFYWDDKKFHGKNWMPLGKEHVYVFFEDK